MYTIYIDGYIQILTLYNCTTVILILLHSERSDECIVFKIMLPYKLINQLY